MMSFIRRIVSHPLGAGLALAFVGLLGLAFVMQDHSGLSGNKTAAGDVAATVGKTTISIADLRAALQRDLDQYRQERPTLDMAQYVGGGGFEASLDRLIDSAAFRHYAQTQGMVVSKKALDGVIASQPGLAGLDGKFSQEKYDAVLRQNGMTDAQVRTDFTNQILLRQMILPTAGAAQVPVQLALPYASLLLEKRSGQIGFVPSDVVPAGPAPTDAEVNAFYARNIVRYRVPERRIVRYALVDAASVAAETAPSDAEIATAFKAQSAKYAAADLRTIVQVVIGDQASAAALAAKVKAGTPIDQAAKAAGLEPATFADTQRAAYAAQSSPAIADAAFAGKVGDVVGPLRAPLGFIVLKIERQHVRSAKSLAEATPELKTALATRKTAAVLGDKRNAFEDAISKTGFDGMLAQQKLTARRTPALLQTGQDPDNPAAKPDPALAPILAAAFAAQAGDDPQTVPLGQDGSFALVLLDKVVPAAPRPLAQIRAAVARDVVRDRGERAARQVAAGIVAAAGKGMALAQAIAATKLKLPPLKPIPEAPRAAIMANPQNVPAPLALLFSMAEGTTKLLEAPQNAGYYLIHLDRIERGDATGNAGVIGGTRGDIAKVIGREYVAQFGKAVEQAVGTSRNASALAALKAELLGGASADSQP